MQEIRVMSGTLAVISGPSGCGKGTVIKKLRDLLPFWLSISDTTRSVRGSEVDGVDYNYLTAEAFKANIDAGEMLEYAAYEGRTGLTTYYGTPKKPVTEHLQRGENVLLEIEVQGAVQIKAKMPEAKLIFILPPSMEELRSRLVGRGTETDADVEKRLQTAVGEIKRAGEFDYIIVNDSVESCAERIKQIITADSFTAAKNTILINKLLGD